MRTTLDLPKELVDEAMSVVNVKTKTELIKLSLLNLINQEKRNKLIDFHGSVDLDIDLDILRKR